MVRLKAEIEALVDARIAGFNSTMVRLKVPFPDDLVHPRHGFNSTMVRLKVGLILSEKPAASLFQFHNGSIKSQFAEDFEAARAGFNSTMVRLKADSRLGGTRRQWVSIPQWFD